MFHAGDNKFDEISKKILQKITSHQGECVFILGESQQQGEQNGLTEEELVASRATLKAISESHNCDCTLIRKLKAQVWKF